MKVAFLEDNRDFAQGIVSCLQAADHVVQHYVADRQCLKALSEEQFDLCLLDWEVHDMSGFEVLASFKLKDSYPPVIFLTARDAEEDIVQVIASGADDYIVKPPSTSVLLAIANALYRRTHKNDEKNQLLSYGNLSVDFGK